MSAGFEIWPILSKSAFFFISPYPPLSLFPTSLLVSNTFCDGGGGNIVYEPMFKVGPSKLRDQC